MFWKRKPITHSVALWILVGLAAVALIAVLGYAAEMSSLRSGVVEARPPKGAAGRQQQQPTVFGTIEAMDAFGVLRISSKQPYTAVVVDLEDPNITRIGGAAGAFEDLKVGTVITATGRAWNDRLFADAIVILENR